MSIRKKPEQAVSLLLARLDKAKEHVLQQGPPTDQVAYDIQSNLSSMFDKFKTELESMRDVFPDIKSWEKTMIDQFCDLEQELDNDIFQGQEKISEVVHKLGQMTSDVMRLKELIPIVDKGKISSMLHVKSIAKPSEDDDHRKKLPKKAESILLENNLMSCFSASFHCLSGSQQVKMCSLCLSVFPTNSTIEKKPLIYWWMGEGMVRKTRHKTAEEVGEQVFAELLDEGFIRASSKNKSLSVSSFVIDPWIHRMLILIARENSLFEFSPQWNPCTGKRRAFLCQENDARSHSISGDQREAEGPMMVFNVNEQYLRMKPEWLSKLKKVEVLQMGRWKNSVAHHIEVEQQNLFNSLGSQKHLKYLSLRGISRIETLPASISKLISLQILDLRACHNLEKLPPTISTLKNLTHLDVSHCYLLESMPKGLEHLGALQVIKGFVIGRAEKNSCKISDLVQLQKLRKLSMRVGETQQDHELGSLGTFPALRILTISWGDVVSSAQMNAISLPPKLSKLDLRCVPFESLPDWLSPSKLPSDLTKLYIKGGRLASLENKDKQEWKVKYLRFRYLPDLKISIENYKRLDEFDCYEFRPNITSTAAA